MVAAHDMFHRLMVPFPAIIIVRGPWMGARAVNLVAAVISRNMNVVENETRAPATSRKSQHESRRERNESTRAPLTSVLIDRISHPAGSLAAWQPGRWCC